jgi:hypothetical protein
VSGILKDPYNLDKELEADSTMFPERRFFDFNYERIVFDNLFNFIILILIIQVVAGIIIDTFTMLREREENIVEDTQNYCFICGKSRDEIEKIEKKNKHAFRFHIKVV